MGNCLECRWWSQPKEFPPDWGVCELAEAEMGDHDLLGDLSPVHPETLAMAFDGESYSAGLATNEQFGCVQFQTQPAPPIEDGTNITTGCTISLHDPAGLGWHAAKGGR